MFLSYVIILYDNRNVTIISYNNTLGGNNIYAPISF